MHNHQEELQQQNFEEIDNHTRNTTWGQLEGCQPRTLVAVAVVVPMKVVVMVADPEVLYNPILLAMLCVGPQMVLDRFSIKDQCFGCFIETSAENKG